LDREGLKKRSSFIQEGKLESRTSSSDNIGKIKGGFKNKALVRSSSAPLENELNSVVNTKNFRRVESSGSVLRANLGDSGVNFDHSTSVSKNNDDRISSTVGKSSAEKEYRES